MTTVEQIAQWHMGQPVNAAILADLPSSDRRKWLARLHANLRELGVSERGIKLRFLAAALGLGELHTSKALTLGQVKALLIWMEQCKDDVISTLAGI